MGQQQLLLTILVTIIIGLAMVVAINTMLSAQENSNESALRQDILAVLNDAQVYYRRSTMLGGGGQSFDGISQEHILSINPTNDNGTYSISGTGNSVTVDGTGAVNNLSLSATATITSSGMNITWSN